MNVEVVAVGTELLLGQIVDTNSSWIGEQLALAGINSHFQTKVGDNPDRMRQVIGQAIERSDAVVITGGLGPTHDDITRDIIAELTGRPLVRSEELVAIISEMYASRGSEMPDSNLSQADVPEGGWPMEQQPGTAAGLVVPVGDAGAERCVIYAVPGVPYEMHEMVLGTVVPDLIRRSGETATIASRTLRTWGVGESNLGEILADEIARLDDPLVGVTLAFNASGVEGLKIRLTAKAADDAAVQVLLDDEEARVREIVGPIVFGVDDAQTRATVPQNMEAVVLAQLRAKGLTLGVAEMATGGMISSRLLDTPGASDVMQGGVVAQSNAMAETLVGVAGNLDGKDGVRALATAAAAKLGTDTMVASGPASATSDGLSSLWLATMVDGTVECLNVTFPSDRNRLRQYATITVLNALRLRLDSQG